MFDLSPDPRIRAIEEKRNALISQQWDVSTRHATEREVFLNVVDRLSGITLPANEIAELKSIWQVFQTNRLFYTQCDALIANPAKTVADVVYPPLVNCDVPSFFTGSGPIGGSSNAPAYKFRGTPPGTLPPVTTGYGTFYAVGYGAAQLSKLVLSIEYINGELTEDFFTYFKAPFFVEVSSGTDVATFYGTLIQTTSDWITFTGLQWMAGNQFSWEVDKVYSFRFYH